MAKGDRDRRGIFLGRDWKYPSQSAVIHLSFDLYKKMETFGRIMLARMPQIQVIFLSVNLISI